MFLDGNPTGTLKEPTRVPLRVPFKGIFEGSFKGSSRVPLRVPLGFRVYGFLGSVPFKGFHLRDPVRVLLRVLKASFMGAFKRCLGSYERVKGGRANTERLPGPRIYYT